MKLKKVTKKGNYGYFTDRKRTSILITVLMFALCFLIYGLAYHHYGTNKNYFTLAAVFLILPSSRYAVNMIMFLRTRECSAKAAQAIDAVAAGLCCGYDYYLTDEHHNYPVCHISVRGHAVAGYTESEKFLEKECIEHMQDIFRDNGFPDMTVKIFRDLSKYTERMNQLQKLDENGKEEKVLDLIGHISL